MRAPPAARPPAQPAVSGAHESSVARRRPRRRHAPESARPRPTAPAALRRSQAATRRRRPPAQMQGRKHASNHAISALQRVCARHATPRARATHRDVEGVAADALARQQVRQSDDGDARRIRFGLRLCRLGGRGCGRGGRGRRAAEHAPACAALGARSACLRAGSQAHGRGGASCNAPAGAGARGQALKAAQEQRFGSEARVWQW